MKMLSLFTEKLPNGIRKIPGKSHILEQKGHAGACPRTGESRGDPHASSALCVCVCAGGQVSGGALFPLSRLTSETAALPD